MNCNTTNSTAIPTKAYLIGALNKIVEMVTDTAGIQSILEVFLVANPLHNRSHQVIVAALDQGDLLLWAHLPTLQV
jgi:hypothetical protein